MRPLKFPLEWRDRLREGGGGLKIASLELPKKEGEGGDRGRGLSKKQKAGAGLIRIHQALLQ